LTLNQVYRVMWIPFITAWSALGLHMEEAAS